MHALTVLFTLRIFVVRVLRTSASPLFFFLF